jgi:hypothetical protein
MFGARNEFKEDFYDFLIKLETVQAFRGIYFSMKEVFCDGFSVKNFKS